ncbi:MAG: hypothetical protein VX642_04950 [Bdellovibrionota bacterium]|nr:hypothetical protein [Bdellovibrionota bacterium]
MKVMKNLVFSLSVLLFSGAAWASSSELQLLQASIANSWQRHSSWTLNQFEDWRASSEEIYHSLDQSTREHYFAKFKSIHKYMDEVISFLGEGNYYASEFFVNQFIALLMHSGDLEHLQSQYPKKSDVYKKISGYFSKQSLILNYFSLNKMELIEANSRVGYLMILSLESKYLSLGKRYALLPENPFYNEVLQDIQDLKSIYKDNVSDADSQKFIAKKLINLIDKWNHPIHQSAFEEMLSILIEENNSALSIEFKIAFEGMKQNVLGLNQIFSLSDKVYQFHLPKTLGLVKEEQ